MLRTPPDGAHRITSDDRGRALPVLTELHPIRVAAGGPLYDSYVRHLMKRLGRRAGIDKRVHPHGLRHTHAAELIREGVRINVVSKQLGHSSSSVTARYIDHIAPAEVIETMRARRWTP